MSTYPEHKLLDSQWRAVYEVIEEAGFDPSDFTRSTTHGQVFGNRVPTLIHKLSGADFVFDWNPAASAATRGSENRSAT